jgi:hypothetical protein
VIGGLLRRPLSSILNSLQNTVDALEEHAEWSAHRAGVIDNEVASLVKERTEVTNDGAKALRVASRVRELIA